MHGFSTNVGEEKKSKNGSPALSELVGSLLVCCTLTTSGSCFFALLRDGNVLDTKLIQIVVFFKGRTKKSRNVDVEAGIAMAAQQHSCQHVENNDDADDDKDDDDSQGNGN